MESKRFKLHFLIRILILSLGIGSLLYSIFILKNPIRSFFSLAFCVVVVSEFLSFVNKTNKDFKNFLDALYYEDFSNYYTIKAKNKRKQSIYERFNVLNDKYKRIAFEKEVNHSLLQTLVKHISIGVFLIDENEMMVLSNQALTRLLNCATPSSLTDIKKTNEVLEKAITNAKPNEPLLIEIVISGEQLKLSLNLSQFKLDGKSYKLFSLQNINSELDQQELIAWQKLIRVLTHEIMNSVTPISSLTSSLNNILTKSIEQNKLDTKQLEYLQSGLNAVEERSTGLLKFTESYKQLTQIPLPNISDVNLNQLIQQVYNLYRNDFDKDDIKLINNIPETKVIKADKSMMEQVFINLFKNAIAALQNTSHAILQIDQKTEDDRLIITIEDNGSGIPEDKIDKIFIPFYTTKEKGTGIGLSFVRQVIRLHNGTIKVKSEVNKGTIFTIQFT